MRASRADVGLRKPPRRTAPASACDYGLAALPSRLVRMSAGGQRCAGTLPPSRASPDHLTFWAPPCYVGFFTCTRLRPTPRRRSCPQLGVSRPRNVRPTTSVTCGQHSTSPLPTSRPGERRRAEAQQGSPPKLGRVWNDARNGAVAPGHQAGQRSTGDIAHRWDGCASCQTTLIVVSC